MPVSETDAQFFQCGEKIRGVGGSEGKGLPIELKGERKGVQGGAGDPFDGGTAVEHIAQQGEAEGVGMHAHLVRAPGGRNGFQQTGFSEAFQHPEGCLGGFALAMVHRSAVAVPHIDAQRVAGGVFLPGRLTRYKGMIHLAGKMPFKKDAQASVDISRAGKENHTTGTPVQTVNDPQAAEILPELFNQAGCA